jgi:hypothetical protein
MDLPKSDKSQNEQDELRRLREENARLKELLTQHGIAWEEPPSLNPFPAPTESAPAQPISPPTTKIALFRRLFRGREDVYPQRWESAKGTSGYSPACGNEWKPGICHKPRVKCGDCNQRQLLPVTDQVIYDHLAGKQTIGVYPLLSDDSCYFLAAISMRPTGGRMPRPSCNPAGNSAFRRRWRFPAPAMALTPGSFLPSRFRPARPGSSGPH